MLVGGPDSNFDENGDDKVAKLNCKGAAPAHCYIDNDNSWSTNEVTIYWNSPLTLILGAVITNL
jgi:endoglucanase